MWLQIEKKIKIPIRFPVNLFGKCGGNYNSLKYKSVKYKYLNNVPAGKDYNLLMLYLVLKFVLFNLLHLY